MRAINDRHLRPIPGGREYSDVPRGRISHTDPPANAPVREGSSVKYWISLGQEPKPSPPPAASVPSVIGKTPAYAWLSMLGLVVVPLLILGSAAGLLLRHVRAKRRLAYTRAVLHIRPSLAHDGETRLVGAPPSIGRTLALRTSLQPGEVHFADPVSIERQEIRHD